jgi:hypothetical protein
MTGRRGELSPAEQRAIGAEVLAARAAGVAWKVLEARYDRSRSQLRRYAALGPPERGVGEFSLGTKD